MSETRDEVLQMMGYAAEWGPLSRSQHDKEMRELLDTYRAEVLREAADELTEMDDAVSFNDAFGWGYGLRKGIDKIREMIEKGN